MDAPTAPHADFARVFTLHGYPMKCGLGDKFEGISCVPDPDYEGSGDEGAASDAVEAEEAYRAPVEEAPAEYGAQEGRRGRKATKGRKAGKRKTQSRKTQRRKTQGKRTQRRRTQRKGKKTQRKQKRRQ